MKRSAICILLIFIIFVSCKKESESKLDVRLSEDTMASIMKDMTKANYMLMISEKDSAEIEKMRADYKKSICKHYNTTAEIYEHDLKIYLQDDKIMKRIFDKARR